MAASAARYVANRTSKVVPSRRVASTSAGHAASVVTVLSPTRERVDAAFAACADLLGLRAGGAGGEPTLLESPLTGLPRYVAAVRVPGPRGDAPSALQFVHVPQLRKYRRTRRDGQRPSMVLSVGVSPRDQDPTWLFEQALEASGAAGALAHHQHLHGLSTGIGALPCVVGATGNEAAAAAAHARLSVQQGHGKAQQSDGYPRKAAPPRHFDEHGMVRSFKEVTLGVGDGGGLARWATVLASTPSARAQAGLPGVWRFDGGGPALRLWPTNFSALTLRVGCLGAAADALGDRAQRYGTSGVHQGCLLLGGGSEAGATAGLMGLDVRLCERPDIDSFHIEGEESSVEGVDLSDNVGGPISCTGAAARQQVTALRARLAWMKQL